MVPRGGSFSPLLAFFMASFRMLPGEMEFRDLSDQWEKQQRSEYTNKSHNLAEVPAEQMSSDVMYSYLLRPGQI